MHTPPKKIVRFAEGGTTRPAKSSTDKSSQPSSIYPSWPHLLEQFTKALSLSPAQVVKMQPTLDHVGVEFATIRVEASQKAQRVLARTITEIRPFLTAEQMRLVDTWRHILELVSLTTKGPDRKTHRPRGGRKN